MGTEVGADVESKGRIEALGMGEEGTLLGERVRTSVVGDKVGTMAGTAVSISLGEGVGNDSRGAADGSAMVGDQDGVRLVDCVGVGVDGELVSNSLGDSVPCCSGLRPFTGRIEATDLAARKNRPGFTPSWLGSSGRPMTTVDPTICPNSENPNPSHPCPSYVSVIVIRVLSSTISWLR